MSGWRCRDTEPAKVVSRGLLTKRGKCGTMAWRIRDTVSLCRSASRATRFPRRPSRLTRGIFEQGLMDDYRAVGAKASGTSAERGANQATSSGQTFMK